MDDVLVYDLICIVLYFGVMGVSFVGLFVWLLVWCVWWMMVVVDCWVVGDLLVWIVDVLCDEFGVLVVYFNWMVDVFVWVFGM